MSPLRSEASSTSTTTDTVSGLPHVTSGPAAIVAANDGAAPQKRSLLVGRRKRWARRNAH